MGQCMDKNDVAGSNKSKNKKKERLHSVLPQQKNTYLTIHRGFTNSLKFEHTPLSACPFLSHKFSNNPNVPEEINLTFMVERVEIDKEANEINIRVINQKQINIYCLLDGEEQVNATGLTVQITGIKYVEKINCKQPSAEGKTLMVVPTRIREERIFVILQPVLKNGQSMFFIYQYVYEPQDKKYKCSSKYLQWSSLAFNLEEIYGGDDLFKVDSGQQCSICLSNPASIILTPCRHMCICKSCSGNYQKASKKCPICRAEFISFIAYN